jgi:hypothetical protein
VSQGVKSRLKWYSKSAKDDKLTVTDIQQYLSAYFVPDVVTNIVCYYNELTSSWPIPQTYLAKYLLAQIKESVALELHALCSVFVPTALSDMVGGSGSSQNVRGGGRGDEPAEIQGNWSGTGGQRCDRVTWCSGVNSLVSSILPNLSFFSLSISDFVFPPPFVWLLPLVCTSHCGDGSGFDTPTCPNHKLKPPTNHCELIQESCEIPTSKLKESHN